MVTPLDQFPADELDAIEKAAARARPPAEWKTFRDDNGRPIAMIRSRAAYEWRNRRGLSNQGRRPKITESTRRAIIDRDGYTCQICRGPVLPTDVHLDHIKPFSCGGLTVSNNLRVTHSACNIAKGARWEK